MTEPRSREPFDGLRAATAPDRLRDRVLAAAEAALAAGQSYGVWDRLCESRAWRTAWASAAAILIAAHVVLSLVPGVSRSRPGVTTQDWSGDLREELALPEVEISPRAARIVLGERPQSRSGVAPITDPENESEGES